MPIEQLKDMASNANEIADQIAKFNGQIVVAEAARRKATPCAISADAAVRKLSELVDVTVTTANGVM